ncbi:MAG: hypothetical protein AB7G87_04900 [Clostridia bacterium]
MIKKFLKDERGDFSVLLILIGLPFIFFLILSLSSIDLNFMRSKKIKNKHITNLSTKVMKGALNTSTKIGVEELSSGNYNVEDIVDRKKLLESFNKVYFTNVGVANDPAGQEEFRMYVPFKAIVFPDRIQVSDCYDNWNGVEFYLWYDEENDRDYYFTMNDTVYYYNNSNNKIIATYEALGISEDFKREVIIDKIRKTLSYYSMNSKSGNFYTFSIADIEEHELYNTVNNITFFAMIEDKPIMSVAAKNNNYKFYAYSFSGSAIKSRIYDTGK